MLFQVMPCGTHHVLLLGCRDKIFRMPMAVPAPGLYLKYHQHAFMFGNDIQFIAAGAVVAFQNFVALTFQISAGRLFSLSPQIHVRSLLRYGIYELCSMEAALINLGLQSYGNVLNLQRAWFEEAMHQRSAGQSPANRLIMVEHKPVYTFGKHAHQSNLLASPEMLERLGAEVYEIERGGDVTFHGPGQLVVYPMFDLEVLNMGVKRFVEALEQSIIACVAAYGIKAGMVNGRTGVWVDAGSPAERKIAAIGIRCSRHYTMHGLALNVHTDLNWFNHIIPCGIADRGVTGIDREIASAVSMKEVEAAMLQCLKEHFPFNFVEQHIELNS